MAAARHLPIANVVKTITIDATFTPTPKGLIVQQGDTVNFVNTSGSNITIVFAANPPGPVVCADLGVNSGSSAGFVAPNYDAAANYDIYVGGTKQSGGPYAIQVGNGPIYVQVTWGGSPLAGQVNPYPVAIPLNGQLLAFSTDTTSYNMNWPSTGDPFTPALTTIVPGVANNLSHTAGSTISEYRFVVANSAPRPTLSTGNGGGTVKVRGS